MKKQGALVLAVIALLLCLVGCNNGDRYNREQFYGVVKLSEEFGRLIVYIPGIGDVEIPENDGCCSCFDGHEPNEDYSYRLREGDLVKINFKYEKSWDENSVKIMESYPARFDRKAGLIEVQKQSIGFEKVDSGYLFSFPETEPLEGAVIGDTLYFVQHGGYDGRAYRKLYATGKITERSGDIITVALTFNDDERDFLKYYSSMSVELTWEV